MKLSEQALLLSVSVGSLSATKKDNRPVQQMESDAATHDTGNFMKRLIGKAFIAPVQAAQNDFRKAFYTHTLPWSKGVGIFPAAKFTEVANDLRSKGCTVDAAVAKLASQWDLVMADAEGRLKPLGLFDPTQYPAKSEVAGMFYHKFNMFPVPEAGDFRVKLGNDAMELLKMQLTSEVDQRLAAAMDDAFNEMRAAIEHMATTLATPDKIFRDSLVGNLKALTEKLPAMNFTGSDRMHQLVELTKKTLVREPEILRNNPDVRAETAKAASLIAARMAKMGSFK